MPTIADVHVRPAGDRWVVTIEGLDEPIADFDARDAALEEGRHAAADRNCELFVHAPDDSIDTVVPRDLLARDGTVQRPAAQDRVPSLPLRNPLLGGTLHWQRMPEHGDDPLTVRITARAGWWGGPVHEHPRAIEHQTVVRGRLGVHVDGRRRVLEAGDMVTFDAGNRHTVWNAGASELEVLATLDPAGSMPGFFATQFRLGLEGPHRVPAQLRELAVGHAADIRWRPQLRYVSVAAGLATLVGMRAARRRRRSA